MFWGQLDSYSWGSWNVYSPPCSQPPLTHGGSDSSSRSGASCKPCCRHLAATAVSSRIKAVKCSLLFVGLRILSTKWSGKLAFKRLSYLQLNRCLFVFLFFFWLSSVSFTFRVHFRVENLDAWESYMDFAQDWWVLNGPELSVSFMYWTHFGWLNRISSTQSVGGKSSWS